METLTLPQILARLAELEPERVRPELGGLGLNEPEPWVFRYEVLCGRVWRQVWYGGDMPRLMDPMPLEYAIRKACEARGWGLSVDIWPDRSCHAWVVDGAGKSLGKVTADSPAHALAAAYLAAVETQ